MGASNLIEAQESPGTSQVAQEACHRQPKVATPVIVLARGPPGPSLGPPGPPVLPLGPQSHYLVFRPALGLVELYGAT